MTKKKSGFWTFLFSLMPGAAEMYMGFMKMGVSLMGLFFVLAIIAGFFGQSVFLLADVVVWFYSFFHAHNLKAMDDEDFYELEDDFLFHLDEPGRRFWDREVAARYRKLAAIVLILLGVSILWNNFLELLWYVVPEYYYSFLSVLSYRIPQLLLGAGIITAGVWLIRGKKQELLEADRAEEMENDRENDTENNMENGEEKEDGRETERTDA